MKPPQITTAAGRQLMSDFYRDQLLNDTLRFWFPRCIDEQHGGFLHCLDRDGSIFDTDKSIWAQGRMSWLLLTLFNCFEPRPEWLRWAESGLHFLELHAFDASGRMYFQVTREGRPIRQRRYAYSEAFASIAWAAHYRATGNSDSALRARQLFELFTHWNFSPGVMPPKFTDTRPMIGLAPRMITLITAQELRANLGDDPLWTLWIDRAIDEIQHLFVKPELQVVMESVAPDGAIVDHCDGRLLNPGHAMEGAWFIMQEGQHRSDQLLMEIGCQMLDWMWDRGWDKEYGGILSFCDVYQRPVQEYWHDMKFWWPHDEAIIANTLAYQCTGDPKYAYRHQLVHDWSHDHFADAEYGEWYGYLHRDGRISTGTKGNLWKSCFHHGRMQWSCWQFLQSMSPSPRLN